ncbi:type II toxin-antitoxin system PemK/MazF family toxin [Candidatus Peregrinibacteria bacterium]|nr:type II toxin-antitoxin system PemK/MazF family toxin [Candidatus Peregrinibacteria bacterium]
MIKVAYGDIWLVNYSPSIGHEYQKIRPAVVISPNELLKRSNLFTCIAITSKTAKIKLDDIELKKTTKNKLHQDSVIKMHHVTSYDKRRLHKYIGEVDSKTLELIKNRLKELYELS